MPMKTSHVFRCAVAAMLGGASAVPVMAQEIADAPAPAGEAGAQDQIIVIGSRRQDRTVADSPVPIDVIGGEQMTNSGFTETNKILGQLVPSFNFPQPAITDGTDALRPATLRGLSPDQTLVLVNGKRRHTSALLNINGSVGRGSAAVDLNTIPTIAIDRIEVLRDGASSQYGSDAIAGVINVQLRRATGLHASATWGKYVTTMDGVPDFSGVVTAANGQPVLDGTAGAGGVYQLAGGERDRKRRDGEILTLATNIGLPVGDDGYLNFTAQYQDRDPTNRSGADPRQQYPSVGGLADPREQSVNRFNHRYGDAGTVDYNFFVNAGYNVTPQAEVYLFGSYGIRDADSAGFFRRPNDARNRNWSASTTSFVPFFEDGFLPLIVSTIEDVSIAGGIRGDIAGWNYDLSAVYGHNSFQFFVEDSFNTSFGERSQQRFDAGKLSFGQTTVNLDLQRSVDVGFTDLSIAFGGEFRNDNFRIDAGDPQSYLGGPFAASPFNAPAGAQVFPGFRPANEVDASRHNFAGYVEVEGDIASILTLQLAGRYEHYSDFGDTLNGKAAARLEPIKGVALRGSISTGFRAPSLHQQYYATTSTNNVNGTLVEIGTFPVSDPVAIALGSQPLDPEESLNLSGGVTFSMIPRLSITADYYNIKINDRIVITENLQGPAVVALLQQAGFNNITSARFFVNGIDTRTQGVEVVGNYRVPDTGFGRFTLTAGYNYNKTKITDYAALPSLPGLSLFGRQESLRLSRGQPRDKINLGLDWDYEMLGLTARANRYGKVTIPGVDEPRDQELGRQWVADLEVRARFQEHFEFAVGANNLFDSYPDTVYAGLRDGQNFGLNGYFIPYSAFSPTGFNGRFLYGRLSVDF
ncbi:iron complex outermembrane receptor protein [Sphingomonas zeicaulis]|uniref:TonB-dependent receptor plug domain-containing protein n=1 Tax=Sphingomonas zeicaulis TaxID=1632740 RepID=UPI003D1EAACF